MWDFDADYEPGLDLGSRRKPVEWVAVAPPVTERDRQNASKRWASTVLFTSELTWMSASVHLPRHISTQSASKKDTTAACYQISVFAPQSPRRHANLGRVGVSAAALRFLPSQSRNQGRRGHSHGQSEAASQTQAPPLAESGNNGSRKPKQQQRRARRPRYEEKPPELASGVHGRLAEAVMLEAESDEGNVEYKLRLKQPNPVRFQQLVSTVPLTNVRVLCGTQTYRPTSHFYS